MLIIVTGAETAIITVVVIVRKIAVVIAKIIATLMLALVIVKPRATLNTTDFPLCDTDYPQKITTTLGLVVILRKTILEMLEEVVAIEL